jgi:hypothetical protein
MYQLGYDWKYAHEWPTLTTEGFQAKLLVTKSGDPPTSWASLNVVSRPCARSYEARESALVNALVFINDIFATTSVTYTSPNWKYKKVNFIR